MPGFRYELSVRVHRSARRLRRLLRSHGPHAGRGHLSSAHPVAEHSSVLMRSLQGVDLELQRNKIENLRLAIATLDGRLIRPGQHLSFWRCIGNPSGRRGYRAGLVLSYGRVESDIGGGLCQLSNLLHWLALHTPLEVVEHHHHGFDVFPDVGRVYLSAPARRSSTTMLIWC